MGKHYKLDKLEALADGDQSFLEALAETFLEEVPADAIILKQAVNDKNMLQTYQTAHKMKPTIEMFDLGVLNNLIEVQNWGKLEKIEENISKDLDTVLNAVENAAAEIKADFNL